MFLKGLGCSLLFAIGIAPVKGRRAERRQVKETSHETFKKLPRSDLQPRSTQKITRTAIASKLTAIKRPILDENAWVRLRFGDHGKKLEEFAFWSIWVYLVSVPRPPLSLFEWTLVTQSPSHRGILFKTDSRGLLMLLGHVMFVGRSRPATLCC